MVKTQGNKRFWHFFGSNGGPFAGPFLDPPFQEFNKNYWDSGGNFRNGSGNDSRKLKQIRKRMKTYNNV